MIQSELPDLPRAPGCYQFRDRDGRVLYVGKAKDLRRRVASYFGRGADRRMRRVAERADRVDFVITQSETEALILEADLVRNTKPPFNVMLKRDAVRPYLRLSDEPFPTLTVAPRPDGDTGRFFGPYPTSSSARRVLELVYGVLPLRRTGGVPMRARERPCVRHALERCPAPCVGAITAEAYARLVTDVVDLLEGRSHGVERRLERTMAAAAAEQDFERAAALRDRLEVLRRHAALDAEVVLAGRPDVDALAVAMAGETATVQVFKVRGGRIVDRGIEFDGDVDGGDDVEAELMARALGALYAGGAAPPLVLVPAVGLDLDAWSGALAARAGRRVELRIPKRGDKRRLLDLAMRNARAALEARGATLEPETSHR